MKRNKGSVSKWGGTKEESQFKQGRVDLGTARQNNPRMARPDAARRVKSYSAATGYVFQYHFDEVNRVRRGLAAGTEYVYMVTADREKMHPLRIFVERAAVEAWARSAGRELTGTEEYAVAKMRLFRAFDELPELATGIAETWPELRVDSTNLEELLEALDL